MTDGLSADLALGNAGDRENGHANDGTTAADADAPERPFPDHYPPALGRLSLDVHEHLQQLLRGFDARQAVLRWEQQLTVRTLGQIPNDDLYGALSREFRSTADSRTAMAILLRDGLPGVDIERPDARRERRRLAATKVLPAYHRAFRHLRPNAKQYITDEDTDDAETDPAKQRFTAMRPVLDGLGEWQERVLATFLDGFDTIEGFLEWGIQAECATYGEIEETFVPARYQSRADRRILLNAHPCARSERELWAAENLIPWMNSGVQKLTKRATELPTTTEDNNLEVPSG